MYYTIHYPLILRIEITHSLINIPTSVHVQNARIIRYFRCSVNSSSLLSVESIRLNVATSQTTEQNERNVDYVQNVLTMCFFYIQTLK